MVPGKGRKGLEKGLAGLCWGLEGRLRRFLDVYVLDKRKDSPKGESPLTGAFLVYGMPSP